MVNKLSRLGLGALLPIVVGVAFVVLSVLVVASVNYAMRQQALTEAEAKARVILDRNLATHTYFSQEMKPNLLKLTDPIRPADYFDPSWMSSTYAVRRIDQNFRSLTDADYYYKEAAINARSPENEADAYERAFLEQLAADPKLVASSGERVLDDEPYFVVLRRGEVMEQACLLCHSTPAEAPAGLVRQYGADRSFHRQVGEVVDTISIRVPLSAAYAAADQNSFRLSLFLLIGLAVLFAGQFVFTRRLLFAPLAAVRDKALQIATHAERVGEHIPVPVGRELRELSQAFNAMSTNLRRHKDELEGKIQERTAELDRSNEQLRLDIAERRQVAEELRRERDFAEGLVATAQAIVLVSDPEGRIVRFNPYWEAISGYTLDEVRGKDWIDTFLPEADRATTRRVLRQAMGDVPTRGYVNLALTRDGRVRYIEWYDKTLKDADGRTIGLLSIGQDVTERREDEEKLKESEGKYRRLVDLAQEGIWAIDADGRTTFVNPRMAEMLGCTGDEMLGSSLLDYMDPQGQALAVKLMERRRLGVKEQHDFEFIRRDGTRMYAIVSTTPITDDEGRYTGALAVVADVTARRRLESQFIAAQKMETVGRLAGGVAHQFNNLLTATLGYAEHARRALPHADSARSDLDQVIEASDRMAALTRQLLAFSRKQIIQPAPLDVNELVHSLEGMLGTLVNDHIERVNVLAPNLGRVKADRWQLEQVLYNLVANARDAMPDGGRLTIETANVTLGDEVVQGRPEMKPGDYVIVAVSDTGGGIAPEVRAHLFEPFFTTKGIGEGTGLGLAAAYGIVKQHGGDIWVGGAPGEGARFEVYLPRLADV